MVDPRRQIAWALAWIRWQRYLKVTRTREAIPRKIAWLLPRQVAMWAYVRVGAHATTGQYANTNVCDLSMMEALSRWPGPDHG